MKIESLQVLRAIAALSVIYLHALDFAGIADGRYRLAIGVDVFFVLSGYIVTQSAMRSRDRRSFALKRLWRILPLYYMASALELAHQPVDGSRLLSSLFLWPRPDILYLAAGWTLSFELLFYALLLPRSIPVTLAALAALAFWNPIVLLFAAGMILHRIDPRYAWLALPIAFAGRSAPEMAESARIVSAELSSVRLVNWGPPATALVAAALSVKTVRFPRPLVFLGDASYSLYLFQIFGLMVGAKFNPGLSGEIYAVWLLSVSAAGGLAAHWLFERRARIELS